MSALATPAPIVSYWPGGSLDYLRRAGLVSCVQAGHAVTLWSHAPVPDLPEGISIRDAGTLLDPATVPVVNRPLIADRMRWLILRAMPGAVFVSPGVLVQGQLVPGQEGYLFGWQDAHHLCPDPVALPADSVELTALLTLSADPAPVPPWVDTALRTHLKAEAMAGRPVPAGHLPWGLLGAVGLTHVLRESGRISLAWGADVLAPVAYADRARLLTRKRKLTDLFGPQTCAVQIWPDETLRMIVETLAGLPRYWCPLGEMLRRAEVNPRDYLPRNLRLHHKDDRWEKAGAPLTPTLAPDPVKNPQPAAPSLPTIGQTGPEARVAIVTCMKNEGPFILEWIAHHRAIGVTDFIVYTNDCTDGTEQLLDLLVDKGIVTARLDNPWRNSDDNKAGDPQRAALWHAQHLPIMDEIDWVLPMDVDEFLSIHVGEGRLADLFASSPQADMISILWRLFGNDDQKRFEEGFVTERMRRAAYENCKKPFQAWGFKTLFRNDGSWGKFSVHRPRNIKDERRDHIRWISGAGVPMPSEFLDSGWRAMKDHAGYNLASLNHYAVRDAESYLVKRDRGRVNHIDEDQGLAYWLRMNHNVVEDDAISTRLPATRAEFARLMADEDIAAIHQTCVAAHRAKIAELHARPDMAALYAAISGPTMENLSRLTPYFGNRVFEAGPQALPLELLDWATRWDGVEPFPGSLEDPVPLPPEEADPDRLLPEGSGLSFPQMPSERTPPSEPKPVLQNLATTDQAPLDPQPEPAPQATQFAPSGDPIWLGEDDRRAFTNLLARTQLRYPMLQAPAAPLPDDNIVIITSMKNEAPFILEWIAWHMAVGVRHFLVYTNDCTDQTNPMLDRLAQMGLVTRLDNPFNREGGQKPQRGALNDAIRQQVVRDSDWYLVIDCDEFVNVHVGDGTLQGMVAAMNHPDIVSMTWRFFGNGGIHAYQDRPVTEQFVRCAPEYLPRPRLGWGFKSMARPTGPTDKIGVHRPLDLDQNREIRWVNGSGRPMPEKSMGNSTWFSRKASIGYDMVTLNHYILRSAESFLVKRERGRINHVDQDQGLTYWTARNYSTETDTRAAEFMATRVAPILAELKDDPELARLHTEAVAWHCARIAHLMAQPDYRALYDAITDPTLRDAVYVAEVEWNESSDR